MDRALALTSKDINLCCHDHPIYFLQDQVKKKLSLSGSEMVNLNGTYMTIFRL